ncbi:hypothetical protein B0J15DRAFT_496831, partial [Fusarium solani]
MITKFLTLLLSPELAHPPCKGTVITSNYNPSLSISKHALTSPCFKLPYLERCHHETVWHALQPTLFLLVQRTSRIPSPDISHL